MNFEKNRSRNDDSSNNTQDGTTHSRRPNYSYIEERNDARTGSLNNKVTKLKELAIQIGDETRAQNKYLKELHDDFNQTESFVESARKRVLLLAKSVKKFNLYNKSVLFKIQDH
ncbi:unnamed protein product [Didymodactylos carnosus]|uniref:t-SNARE coiled-coil homology domain-containing protein n=1 Tax=Didymodactylos carnosus TaxID=1234261 RepID=A0A815A3J0_9BILA|nr:unnamed protein product [Didymodactylos carnosus]CAF1250064.1 unnamed protein product [Didymodactylos carnosus]CAF3713335.1 unnamed protein product [Didymodactylos carnosus]CAF4018837.1 unnamed protein product [Didymodactylos carnosus]